MAPNRLIGFLAHLLQSPLASVLHTNPYGGKEEQS